MSLIDSAQLSKDQTPAANAAAVVARITNRSFDCTSAINKHVYELIFENAAAKPEEILAALSKQGSITADYLARVSEAVKLLKPGENDVISKLPALDKLPDGSVVLSAASQADLVKG